MRVLIQRVKRASVMVGQQVVGQIGSGLLVFFAVHKDDRPDQTQWLVNKVANLRIFCDEAGKMNHSVKEAGGGVLIVSQFTLYGTCQQGRRPEFTDSASGEVAEAIYDQFVEQMRGQIEQVATGQFAALMEVALVNDGPVTLLIEGKKSS